MSINLALLLAASFLPFPTKLMAESLRLTGAERSAVIFYGAALLVISLLLNAMWRLVAAARIFCDQMSTTRRSRGSCTRPPPTSAST
jgi:uncharacterized membrane protein